MIETLKFLTQISLPRNYKNIDSLNEVVRYLTERFNKIGLNVEHQIYLVQDNSYINIIASLNPHYSKRLVVGAHYMFVGI